MSCHYEFNRLGPPSVLNLVNQDIPPPSAKEVQVEMRAAGLNRAELLFLQGQYLVAPELPGARIGMEGAGIVRTVGADVKGVSVEDRVAITPALDPVQYGVLADVVNVPASAIEPIPDGVSFEDAAAFWMAFGTAYGMTVISGGLRDKADQTVLITAASSSVGTAAFQVIREHGATSVATTRSAEKRQSLLEAGADHVIVTGEDDLLTRVLELTDGKGADIICDAINGPVLPVLAQCAAREATIVEMGLLSGELPQMPFFDMIGKGLVVTAFHLSWQMLHVPERRRKAAVHLLGHLASGTYRPVIDKVFPFSQVREAYNHLASNQQLGKIIVRMDGE